MMGIINLDNFEFDSIAKKTPDVLNSPRSLKACYKLLIEPNELVYRNLEEYEETLADLPLSEIYRIYERDETERQSKLLKCRETRKKIMSEEIHKQTNKFHQRAISSMIGQNRRKRERDPDFGGSDTEINYGSDTESHDENWNNHVSNSDEEKETRSNNVQIESDSSYLKPKIKSKLKSVSNIDFKKLASSPRQFCPCQLSLNDNEIYDEYLKRYGDIISSSSANDLSRDDKKILNLLILKKGRQTEWDKRVQELRKAIEEDKIAQYRKSQTRMQNWSERLAEKRRIENMENTNRYLALEQKARENRCNLMKYLETRDSKVQDYLEQMQYRKRKELLDRHRQEAIRQLEVGKAIDRLLEADKRHRQDLAEKLQQRMNETEIRKRRREENQLRHISEMNKLEEAKRELKLEQLEQEARQSNELLRSQIEEKEHRATMNYLANLRLRNTILSQGSGNRNMAIEKTRKVHSDLLRGLEEWNQKVYELHLAAQERATMNYYTEMNRRRARVASERLLREERSVEILKRVKEMEEQRKELVKTVIQSKDFRSARIKEQKEQKIYISRLRAQHGAELRGALKEKLDPETFDKKAARAEIEYRILRKFPQRRVRFTNQIPRINIGGNRCYCGCRSRGIQSRDNIFPVWQS